MDSPTQLFSRATRAVVRFLAQDCPVAARVLLRRRAFLITGVSSLALAIGTSTAAFSVVDAIRFRSLPLRDGDRLVAITEVADRDEGAAHARLPDCRTSCDVSYRTYSTVLRQLHLRSLDGVAAFTAGLKALDKNGEPVALLGSLASDNLFAMLGVRPQLGRGIAADDDKVGAAPVVVISHDLWVTQFGRDPSTIGRDVQLSDTRYTIIGIMPPGFEYESGAKFWLPVTPVLDPSTRPSIQQVAVIGHMAPGMQLAQVQAELSTIVPPPPASDAARGPLRLSLTALPLRSRYADATQGHDLVFLGIVACILLIASANLANLIFVRALDERRDLAIRGAVGASPSQIASHVIAQTTLLGLGGAALGLLIAQPALSVIRSVAVLDSLRPAGMDYRLDARVLAFSAALSVILVVVLSVLPIRLVTRRDTHLALRESGPAAQSGRGARRAQRAFVIAQVACASALLVATGLAAKTLSRLSHINPGFDVSHLVFGAPSFRHTDRVIATYMPLTRRIEAALQSIPGVRSVGLTATVPLGSATALPEITLVGSATPLLPSVTPVSVTSINASYFAATGISMTRGRAFSDADRDSTAAVAIVNEWAARHWWPNGDPVGGQIRVATRPDDVTTMTVVGIARDNRAGQTNILFASDGPELYRPFVQAPSPFPGFFVRSDNPAATLGVVRRTLAALVPARPVFTTIVADQIDTQLAGLRTNMLQVLGFAIIGLALSVIGVYGVVAYTVAGRTREIGIRRALGATSIEIHRIVVGDALMMSGVGVAVGFGLAITGARFLAPLLHGTPPTDVPVYGAIALIVLTAAFVAAFGPARRAARVSPTVALRSS